MPEILAYTGVANTIKTYANPSTNATVVQASGQNQDTYNITIGESGIIQSFLATLNLKDFSTAPASGKLSMTIKRNGVLVSSSTFEPAEYLAVTGAETGIIYSESLGFLSGAQVDSGEVFTFDVLLENANANFTITYDSVFTIIISPQPKVYYA